MPSPRQNAVFAAQQMRVRSEPGLVARNVSLGNLDESGRMQATDAQGNSLSLRRLTPFALPAGVAVPAAVGKDAAWVDA